MTRLNAANNAQALLVGDITAAATSFYVDDASVFPAAPFLISIDDEIMKVGTVLGNLLSDIDRAQEGTTAAAHASDSLVENRWTAGMYNALATQEEVDEHKADDTKHITSTERTIWNNKLDASAYTAADVLAKVKTVDGDGSGLDADLLDGAHAGNGPNNVLKLDSGGFVPLPNIPGTLTGKSADMVDGKHFSDIQNDAQAKVDTHASSKQTHGISGGYYIAKTSRSDQLPAWNDIQGKPDLALASDLAAHKAESAIHKTSDVIRTETNTQLKVEVISSSVSETPDAGRIIFDTSQGKFFGGNGTEWV